MPLAELTTLAAHRGAFGDDVLAAFTTQLRTAQTAAQTVLDTASQANRDTLLASEQRQLRQRDSRARRDLSACSAPSNSAPSSARFVPESQRGTPEKKKTGGLFGLELRALAEGAAPAASLRRMNGARTSSTAWRPRA